MAENLGISTDNNVWAHRRATWTPVDDSSVNMGKITKASVQLTVTGPLQALRDQVSKMAAISRDPKYINGQNVIIETTEVINQTLQAKMQQGVGQAGYFSSGLPQQTPQNENRDTNNRFSNS